MKKKSIIISLILLSLLITLVYCIENNPNLLEINTTFNKKNLILEMKTKRNYKIYYTLDGSIPDENSILYKKAIELNKNSSPNTLTAEENQNLFYGRKYKYDEKLPKATIVRAIAVSKKGEKSEIINKTYFVGLDLNNYFKGLPVISIITDPSNLIDYEKGILVKGKTFADWEEKNGGTQQDEEENNIDVEANFTNKGKNWEREISIEYFNGSNEAIWQQNAGIRVKGGSSRLNNQKSFNIYFRDKYGNSNLKYELIKNAENNEGKTINNYVDFTLRNGGNTAASLKYKDSLLQNLAKGRKVDTQTSNAVIVFLNGEYWGPYSLEEKYTGNYYHEHYGISEKNVIAIKEEEVEVGNDEDIELYNTLMTYAKKDLSNSKTYEEFSNIVDIESMIDYFAIQTYIGNIDWGINDDGLYKNTLLWRTKNKENNPYGDQKWRWSLYDLEFSSNLYNMKKTAPDFCSVNNAIKKHSLFASAMKNKEFKKEFYDVLNEIKEENYNPVQVESKIEEYDSIWRPQMGDYRKRFGGSFIEYNNIKENTLNYFKYRYEKYNFC